MTDTVGGAMLTLGAAVKAVTVSRSTLQRRLKAGDILGATHNSDGEWQIPYNSLLQAGYVARVSEPDPVDPTKELEEVKRELARALADSALWRTIAEERGEALKVERRQWELMAGNEVIQSKTVTPTPSAAAAFAEAVTAEDETEPAAPAVDLEALAARVAELIQPPTRRRWWKR